VAASAVASGFPAVAHGVRLHAGLVRDGVRESVRHHLVVMLRGAAGREASPTAAIIDTQSVTTTEGGGPQGS
jgi:putative transposase